MGLSTSSLLCVGLGIGSGLASVSAFSGYKSLLISEGYRHVRPRNMRLALPAIVYAAMCGGGMCMYLRCFLTVAAGPSTGVDMLCGFASALATVASVSYIGPKCQNAYYASLV